MYFFIILSISCQFLYLSYIQKNQPYRALIAKTIASLSFVLLALFAKVYIKALIIGLIFDAFGDVFLGLRRICREKLMLGIGAGFFVAGHYFFLNFLLVNFEPRYLPLLLSLPLALGYFYYVDERKTKSYPALIIIVYLFAVVSVGISAFFLLIQQPCTKFVLLGGGCLLFMFSDFLLIHNTFIKKSELKHRLYAFLYYLGQISIALSLYY